MLRGGLNTLYFDYLVSLYAVTMMENIRNGPNIRSITTSGQRIMALLRDDDQKAIAPPLSRKAEHVPLELSSRGESAAWREMRWRRMAICMGSKSMLRTRRAGATVKSDGSRDIRSNFKGRKSLQTRLRENPEVTTHHTDRSVSVNVR
jgi:hypothetical protein